ncbi:MAG TPA: hypothetical protein VEP49_08700 [Acidimicrobiia bacterium]|nr:hypothetical protein [Acidimicrobiia bacterium]
MAEAASYQGGSGFLRWWPRLLLALAVSLLVIGWSRSIQWAALLAVASYIHAKWLPCQFAILADGLELWFPFGRRLFLPKSSLTIRIDIVGAIALVGRRRKLGYPLMDRVLYEPGRSLLLRTAFSGLGYELA